MMPVPLSNVNSSLAILTGVLSIFQLWVKQKLESCADVPWGYIRITNGMQHGTV